MVDELYIIVGSAHYITYRDWSMTHELSVSGWLMNFGAAYYITDRDWQMTYELSISSWPMNQAPQWYIKIHTYCLIYTEAKLHSFQAIGGPNGS